jgi:RNA polymerase sigma factor (sigma-70 family)
LMQDVWLQVLRGIGRLQDPTRLRAWLFGIAHRRVMDRLRERYAALPGADLDPDEVVDEQPHPDRELEARELERGLHSLPPIEREVLSLFYLDELPLSEVAQVLVLPIGTVKSRLFRARKLLRNQITGDRHD